MTREEALLMPRYALRPPADRSLDDGRREDARELAMLEGELEALERDVRSARSLVAARNGALLALRAPAPRRRPGGAHIRLRDGLEIHVRPIEPGDAPLLKEAFERLTALTRYKRFLGRLDQLTRVQLRYLTTVDHTDHEALVAVDGESGALVGVARYVRDRSDPDLAEVAVVVTDAWQRRGVASALLERLAERARAAGAERLVARSIAGDHADRALAARAGQVVAAHISEWTFRLPLEAARPASPAAASSLDAAKSVQAQGSGTVRVGPAPSG